VVPDVNGRVERPEPLATVGLWRDCSVIDQRVQFAALDCRLISSIAAPVLASSARSTWM
jgi:hypothetical protein